MYFNEEGKILNINKVKGLKKALATLLGYMKTKGSELEKYKVFILQADCEKEANAFVDSIKAQFGNLDVVVQPVGPVIGAHCGPGTIGLVFHAKEK